MKYVSDGYCGLYCGACANLLGTQAGTEQDICFGCKSDTNSAWCSICGLKACAKEKELDFCYQCSAYPCANLTAFKEDARYPYHQEVYEYMKIIEKEGKDTWLEKMKIRWSCPECHKAASWWELSCQECNKELNGYQKP
jgi:hypothetical protein